MRARPSLLTTGLALAILLAGCGPDEASPAPTATIPGSGPSAAEPEPTPTPTVSDDDAALRDLWDRYLAATVRALNGPDPDPTIWQGIGGDEVVAEMTTTAQSYLDNDMVYTGGMRTLSLDVGVQGDSALLHGCVDLSDWVAVSHRGDTLPTPASPVVPRALQAQRQADGTWRVMDDTADTSEITC